VVTAAPMEFWCEFSSPYGYVGAELIARLAARTGHPVVWRPFLLGAVFKVTGAKPLVGQGEPKESYYNRDFTRTAAFHGVPFQMPERFPFAAIAATRACYWAEAQAPTRMGDLALALYRACYRDRRPIADGASVVAVAAEIGLDAAAVEAGIADPAVKQRAIQAAEQALAAGVFGSPTVTIDGERFWGTDRLDQVERWITHGPW
jgi:2-hydroxychromene-2-carboxylate isomerase